MRKGAPWFPTPRRRSRALLAAAGLKPGETFVDAGCGDGRVCILAVKEFGAKAVGIDIHPVLASLARFRARLAGVAQSVDIRRGDVFREDLSSANVLFLFLLQDTNERLQEKLLRELRPGTRIVSYAFTLPRFHEMPSGDPFHHLYVVNRA